MEVTKTTFKVPVTTYKDKEVFAFSLERAAALHLLDCLRGWPYGHLMNLEIALRKALS